MLGCQVVRRDCVVLLREDQVTLELYLLQALGEILQVLFGFLEGDLLLTESLVQLSFYLSGTVGFIL